MTCVYPYKIAVGHDNVAGLTLVSALTDGVTQFIPPRTIGNYQPGELLPLLSKGVSVAGTPSTIWELTMTSKQHKYWRTTFCAGGFQGNVTISTITEEADVYANYNAKMTVPSLPQTQQRTGDLFLFFVAMKDLVVIPPPP